MTARRLFREADLARAVRVVTAAGMKVGRVTIDAAGTIMIDSLPGAQVDEPPVDRVAAAVEAARRRNAERRAAKAVPRQNKAR